MDQKKILAWSDAATAGTGFGTVSKHVLGALHATGKYEIHHLAINFHGDFVDRATVPWQVQPSKLLDPKDPQGLKMFFRTLVKNNYDYVWILNDLHVTKNAVQIVEKVKQDMILKGKKPPIFVYYYPVDCHAQADSVGMLEMADVPVCYTQHGREETLITRPDLEPKIEEIPHGVNTNVFRPLPYAEIQQARAEYFGVKPDTFVVVQVNRNSTRKQIPYSLLAFKEFKRHVPNSIMYCHSMMVDQGGDIRRMMEDLKLCPKTDVVFPARYSPGNAAPEHILNRLYNTGDLFLTTHLGEGWGLTITEAMAAGVPVVAPDNTCMSQQLGENSERGYMYKCNDWACIDNSGFRKKGLIPDIVETMLEVYRAGRKADNPVVIAARQWAEEHNWRKITQQWVALFETLESKRLSTNQLKIQEV